MLVLVLRPRLQTSAQTCQRLPELPAERGRGSLSVPVFLGASVEEEGFGRVFFELRSSLTVTRSLPVANVDLIKVGFVRSNSLNLSECEHFCHYYIHN